MGGEAPFLDFVLIVDGEEQWRWGTRSREKT